MKTVKHLLPTVVLFFSFGATGIAAETVEPHYIQSISATLYARPAFNSEALTQVERGTCFTDARRQGKWVRVTHKGKTAYISAFSTATTPPRSPSSPAAVSGTGSHLRLRGRVSSSPVAVAGVKGLAYEDRSRLSSGAKVDHDALAEIEALEVTPEELQKFMSGGKP